MSWRTPSRLFSRLRLGRSRGRRAALTTRSHAIIRRLRPTLACALLAPACAAPLSPIGVPADAHATVQLDHATACKTQTGAALLAQLENETALSASAKNVRTAFRKQTSYDPARDLASITIGFYKAAQPGQSPEIFAILRGNFPVEKILALTAQSKIAITRDGARARIASSNLGLMLAPALGRNDCARFQYNTTACIADAHTILFARAPALIDKLLGALSAASDRATPAPLTALAAQTGTPILIAHIKRPLTPDSEMLAGLPVRIHKADFIFVVIGENGMRQRTLIRCDYASPVAAAETAATLRLAQRTLPVNLAMDNSLSGAQIEIMTRLIPAFQIDTNGNTLTLSLESPSANAASVLSLLSN